MELNTSLVSPEIDNHDTKLWVELALAERDSKNAGISFFFFLFLSVGSSL